jgi:hypothetical protein
MKFVNASMTARAVPMPGKKPKKGAPSAGNPDTWPTRSDMEDVPPFGIIEVNNAVQLMSSGMGPFGHRLPGKAPRGGAVDCTIGFLPLMEEGEKNVKLYVEVNAKRQLTGRRMHCKPDETEYHGVPENWVAFEVNRNRPKGGKGHEHLSEEQAISLLWSFQDWSLVEFYLRRDTRPGVQKVGALVLKMRRRESQALTGGAQSEPLAARY